jgi:hypothetical protein
MSLHRRWLSIDGRAIVGWLRYVWEVGRVVAAVGWAALQVHVPFGDVVLIEDGGLRLELTTNMFQRCCVASLQACRSSLGHDFGTQLG